MNQLLFLLTITISLYSLEINGYSDTIADRQEKIDYFKIVMVMGTTSSSDSSVQYLALNGENEALIKRKNKEFVPGDYVIIISGGGNRVGIKTGGSIILDGDFRAVKITDGKGKLAKPGKIIGKYMVYGYENNTKTIDGIIAFNNAK